MEAVRIGRRRRPTALAGDRGYSFPHLRCWLRQRHIRAVIPRRRDQRPVAAPFDHRSYRRRSVIERGVGWLKERRRIATRYEKLAVHYLAMLSLGMIEKYLTTLFAYTA